jgi:two-component system, cell cycle response regulator DivK
MSTALVIEDNPDNARLVIYPLKRAGYEVVVADTGEEGVDLALSTAPSLILVDIGLPGIDGYEVIRRIRAAEHCDDIPVVAITSYAMAGDRGKILAAGADAYFEKPIDPMRSIDQIHAILGRGQQ